MNILVIGGTGFVGRHLVDRLLLHGHTITLFNRGKSAPGIFPGVEHLSGDRDVSHNVLKNRRWDAAIDTNGRRPRAALEAARLLKPNVGHFSFISSISAYAAMQPYANKQGVDLLTEDSELAELKPADIDDTSMMTYGSRKAVCEQWIQKELDDNVLIIRPGLIIGPWDSTDRFSYWPIRMAEGGTLATPGSGKDPVRFIDARDLANWLVDLIEKRLYGIYNCIGPQSTMSEMLNECRTAVNPQCDFRWIDEKILEREQIKPWSDMPVWAPGMISVDHTKAAAFGLRARSVAESSVDIVNWAKSQNLCRPLKAGLSKEREDALLTNIS